MDDIEISQSMNDENVHRQVIVQLSDPSSKNGANRRKAKSGLVRISSFRRLRNTDRKLREQFSLWMPPSCQLNGVSNNESTQARTESIEFDDVNRAVQYIQSCVNKRIILILSDSYARNKKIVSEFKQLSQIALIYRYTTERLMKKWFERWSIDAQFCIANTFSSSILEARIQDLDETGQLLFKQLFLMEMILKDPRTDVAKEEFFHFCRLTYDNDLPNLRTIEDFEVNYYRDTPITWYTKNNSIFRIVSRACASPDINTFFRIRFFLRALHKQLQQLHDEQLATLLQTDLLVYRGVKMSSEELSRLQTIGNLFVTRNFVSTTTAEDVACMFSGDGIMNENQISVLICMHIDREETSEKPIAFISEISQFADEAEVMLSMGIVFRVVSCRETTHDLNHSIKIKMVRGREEQEIEKKLSRLRFFGSIAMSSPFLTADIALSLIENTQYSAQHAELTSHLLKPPDHAPTEDPTNIVQNNLQSTSVRSFYMRIRCICL